MLSCTCFGFYIFGYTTVNICQEYRKPISNAKIQEKFYCGILLQQISTFVRGCELFCESPNKNQFLYIYTFLLHLIYSKHLQLCSIVNSKEVGDNETYMA